MQLKLPLFPFSSTLISDCPGVYEKDDCIKIRIAHPTWQYTYNIKETLGEMYSFHSLQKDRQL